MDLTEEQWKVIKEFIPKDTVREDRRGRPWSDRRAALNGILWILRTGAPWQDLPERYGAYQTERGEGVRHQILTAESFASRERRATQHPHRVSRSVLPHHGARHRREAIFRDEADRRFFLQTLGEACLMTGWRIHAWVLLPNHYHLFVETPEANLSKGMQWLQNTLTRRFNTRHRLWGRLFGDRYKAVLVEGEKGYYYETLLDYIHLNPARCGLVRPKRKQSLLDYPWSSVAQGYALPPQSATGMAGREGRIGGLWLYRYGQRAAALGATAGSTNGGRGFGALWARLTERRGRSAEQPSATGLVLGKPGFRGEVTPTG